MKKVIITGPTGAIGIALIELLISKKIQVTAICHEGSCRISYIPKSKYVTIVECNLEKLSGLASTLSHDYDAFFHLGWACTFGDDRNNVEAQIQNIQYTIDGVELAAELGCKKFIGAGSQAEYGRYDGKLNGQVPVFPENGYGMAKLCAGQLSRIRCQQLGLEHVWTRILSVYGPYDGEKTMVISIIKDLLSGKRPHCTKGEQIWDYIYSKDAARAFVALAEKGVHGKIYCIGAGEGIPLIQYIMTIHDKIDPKADLGIGDIPYSEKQVMFLCADITELTADTGFVPETTFEEGITATIQWVRKKEKGTK